MADPGNRTLADAIRADFRGELLEPGDAGYDRARVVWNAAVDRRPAVIARCRGVADVLHALAVAREAGVEVAVRGGGHDVAGNGVCDGGVVLDLSPMKGVRVDPVRRVARAQAGLTWAELDRETQAFGLATTGGQCSGTGVAGVTLGGGVGWLMRRHGLTVDNLLSVDVVTADGRLLTASEDENRELFWGLRGGGGNFGVVTGFEFRLHPVREVVAGLLVHPGDRLADVLALYRSYAAVEPDSVTSTVIALTAPPMPGLPESLHNEPAVAIGVCHSGPPEEADEALRPLREFGPPAADMVGPMPYLALQSMFDGMPAGDYGYRQSIRTGYLAELGDDAIAALVRHAGAAVSPLCLVELLHLGGAVARVAEDDTAFPGRDARFFCMFQSTWSDPAGTAAHTGWTREGWDAFARFSDGRTHPGFLDADEPARRVADAYGERKTARLAALKRRVDPANFFHLNKNIRP
ncbi:FAD-binding oxidoreductase [Saccharothrix syringae]|uniref:FAD-binding oxidoreductase n=1 Tax=Saccharothrix syringae TaxID=103733 RepID=A0A5Q0H641_SACSY|nr:FAD-binding oxidoreductase [Saccharothrix syringae]QFZ21330.1 FAD-binding oxidoreductase [Saccharothrix syringae]